MEIYKKLHEARKYIKTLDEPKNGFNDYSKYKYYTPDQISKIVFMACEDQGIIPIFNLRQNELGLSGHLDIVNINDENDSVSFQMSTAMPEIKATNITQQLGGAVTYTERYLLMTAFDIKDNNLDPDSKDNRKGSGANTEQSKNTTQKPTGQSAKAWLNKWNKDKSKVLDVYTKTINRAIETKKTVNDLREFFTISKEVAIEIEKDLKA